eukprot:gene22450-biopygen8015
MSRGVFATGIELESTLLIQFMKPLIAFDFVPLGRDKVKCNRCIQFCLFFCLGGDHSSALLGHFQQKSSQNQIKLHWRTGPFLSSLHTLQISEPSTTQIVHAADAASKINSMA